MPKIFRKSPILMPLGEMSLWGSLYSSSNHAWASMICTNYGYIHTVHACMHVWMCGCVYVCMDVCTYLRVCVCVCVSLSLHIHVYAYIYIYLCVYAYIYIYSYINIYAYIHIRTHMYCAYAYSSPTCEIRPSNSYPTLNNHSNDVATLGRCS